MRQRTFGRRDGGFSLVELVTVVLIIGILAAVAMPAYQDYVRRGYRASAESFLMDVAQREQQYFMDNRSYANAIATLGTTAPSDVSSHYSISIVAADGPPPTFTATATPTGDQAKDKCGTLSLTNAGTKSASSGSNCW